MLKFWFSYQLSRALTLIAILLVAFIVIVLLAAFDLRKDRWMKKHGWKLIGYQWVKRGNEPVFKDAIRVMRMKDVKRNFK